VNLSASRMVHSQEYYKKKIQEENNLKFQLAASDKNRKGDENKIKEATVMGEVYLDTKIVTRNGSMGRRYSCPDNKGGARPPFTRLTPNLFVYIPAHLLPAGIGEKLVPAGRNANLRPESSLLVHEDVLRAGLSELSYDTPVVENDVHPDFRLLTAKLLRFADLIPVMIQTLDLEPCAGGGDKAASTENRGVTAWLDRSKHPAHAHIEELGIAFSLNRFYHSSMDRAVAWLSLGIEIVGFHEIL
jgi:hypothetical protein